MKRRRISWPTLVVALVCLVPVVAGVLLVLSAGDGSDALGFALVGFFGAGAVVLGRKALSPDH